MTFFKWAAAAVLVLAAASARAADLPGPILMDAIAANNPCADAAVHSRIIERFDWADRNTWHRGVLMASLSNGRSSNHPYFEPGMIQREYCMADAMLSDGSGRTVYYAIEYGQGFASIGNYVNFCVLGLDPWHVYDEACRTVR